jgi:pimeloyl-ACP methyl ester carboxylesterase
MGGIVLRRKSTNRRGDLFSRYIDVRNSQKRRTSILEQKASNVGPAAIDIAYERLGNPESPAVLLIMGIGVQFIHWPESFCQALVDNGLQVIRFDNRDSGRSTHMTEAPPPNLPAALAGDLSSVSYGLSDLAADAAGLLDVLGIAAAHIVGASLGGAIAQTMAIEHPARVRSLTSMMSTTGNQSVGQASPEVIRDLFGGAPPTTREEVIEQMLRIVRVAGSPEFPADEEEVAERAGRAYDRSYDPIGVARQALASVAAGDRTERLRQLDVPTLVIHGAAERMCDVSGGRATADAIPGAELVVIEGMGHNLPPGLRIRLATIIAGFIAKNS